MNFYSERDEQAQKLKDILDELYEATIQTDGRSKFVKGFEEMRTINYKFLPYAAVTNFIYANKEKTDFATFNSLYISHLRHYEENTFKYCESCSEKNHCDECKASIDIALKIYEHMTLAQQQLDSFFHKHQRDIERIDVSLKELEVLKKELQEISSSYINILGIFAAILMGAFGAMQGFSSLFANAQHMKLSKILVISGVGGLAVIAILHMLLHSVSKLAEKNLSSTEEKNAPFWDKYPFFSLSSFMLWGIIVAGVVLKFSQEYPDPFSVNLVSMTILFIGGLSLPVIALAFLKKIIDNSRGK